MIKRTVQQIKDDQGYRKKGPVCGNCKHYTSIFKTKSYGNSNQTWEEETNKRCVLGQFATGKSCWCIKHEFTENIEED